MHFGKRLEKDMIEHWRPHYLQYKLLKKQIKEMEDALAKSKDESVNGLLINPQVSYQAFSFPGPKSHRYGVLAGFKPVLDAELGKVNDFVMSKVKELENRILLVLRTNLPDEKRDLFIVQQQKEIDDIARELVDLDKFIRQNIIAIQKIIKKFDKRLHFDVSPWLNAQLMENEPFLKVNLDALLIALSDGYEKLTNDRKLVEGDSGAEGKKGISAQTFERKTTKYWVKSENLMAVKVAIIKNLPIYMFDRKMDRPQQPIRNYLRSFNEIYGDLQESSPITSIYLDNDDLNIYHTRIKREEGAELFRFRWYGDAKSLPEKEYIFLERKTHHESWVLAKSVKERFPIKTKNVDAFLNGEFDPTKTMHKWMKPDSKGLRLLKSEQELEKANLLAQQCQKSIQERHLKAAVRTVYRRAAFQARDHNEVRISIDTSLMMVKEKTEAGQWCRDMLQSQLPSQDILQFPFSILEVKLNCDQPPAWITDLLADTQTIVECPKFSKFLTGIGYHYYENVKELPHWFENQVSIDPRNRFLSVEEKEQLAYEDSVLQFEQTEEPLKPKQKNHITIEIQEQNLDDEKTPLLAKQESSQTIKRLAESGKQPSSNSAFSQRTLHQNDSFFGTLRKRFGFSHSSVQQQQMKPIRPANRIKIEPKTSFANERTLIQWISAASLMITLATLIMTSGSQLGFQAGFVFFPLAFLIMIYAIVRYQYRAWAFKNRQGVYYDDLIGPVVLVICIAAAMCVILWLMFYFNQPIPQIVPDQMEECRKLNTTGMSSYFPWSDVYSDQQGVVAVGPMRLWHHEQVEVWPNQKLSAVTRGGGYTFIAVEKPQMKIIMKPDVAGQEKEILIDSISHGYNISLKAMTYYPECTSTQDCLILSTQEGILLVYTISDYKLYDLMPAERLAGGLVDGPTYKHISGLYWETNRIWVLYGGSRILRCFDWLSGKVLKEWYLPGTSFQWTGVSFTKQDGKDWVYLAQSIPGGIWSFEWQQSDSISSDLVNGQFPQCANVYDGDLVEKMAGESGDKFRRSKLRHVIDY